jgi:hypothetical protein
VPAPSSLTLKRTGLRSLRIVVLVSCLPLVLGGFVLGARALSDSHRVPRELVDWKLQTGVMLCTEGSIEHGDGSFWDRMFKRGDFRCGNWKMRYQKPTTGGLVEWPTSPRR